MEELIEEYGMVIVFVVLGGISIAIITFLWNIIGKWLLVCNDMLLGG